MPYLGLIYLVVLAVTLVDIITTDDAAVRGLPKLGWVLLVVLIPLVGGTALAGHWPPHGR